MMMKFLTFVTAVLLVPALVLSQPTGKAPTFKLKTVDGKTIDLQKLQGKVVVVNFWATWCGPCKAEIPGFQDMYKQYRSKGLEIVGVSLDRDGWTPVKPFIEQHKIAYPIVIGDGDLADAYGGINAIPTTFIIDKKGNIVNHHIGYLDKGTFENLIKELL
jgi:peroxiredoxin